MLLLMDTLYQLCLDTAGLDGWQNSVYHDQTPNPAAPDQGLHCLLRFFYMHVCLKTRGKYGYDYPCL